SEPADDSTLATDDFADVVFGDFELVDGGVAILDLVDLDAVRIVYQRLGDVFDETFQIRLELIFVELLVFMGDLGFGAIGRLLSGLFGHDRATPMPSRAWVARERCPAC